MPTPLGLNTNPPTPPFTDNDKKLVAVTLRRHLATGGQRYIRCGCVTLTEDSLLYDPQRSSN